MGTFRPDPRDLRKQRPPKHQTVIIFDWDDTLLCTSWLSGLGNRRPDRTVDAQLKAIERRRLGARAVVATWCSRRVAL